MSNPFAVTHPFPVATAASRLRALGRTLCSRAAAIKLKVLRQLAAGLRLGAAYLDPAATAAPTAKPFQRQRQDVDEWMRSVSPALQVALDSEWNRARFRAVLAKVPYPPDEQTAQEFLRLTPEWLQLHPKFAAALLRKLVSWRHLGQPVDERAYGLVARWLLARSQTALHVPRWYECVQFAQEAARGAAHPFSTERRLDGDAATRTPLRSAAGHGERAHWMGDKPAHWHAASAAA